MLKSWPVNADMFDGELLAGPIPMLFSEDMDSSQANITADPLKSHWDMSKISKCFFMPECLPLKDALAIIKKPR